MACRLQYVVKTKLSIHKLQLFAGKAHFGKHTGVQNYTVRQCKD